MPLRRTRTFDSERQEVHTVLGNDDVDGAVDLEQKAKWKCFQLTTETEIPSLLLSELPSAFFFFGFLQSG